MPKLPKIEIELDSATLDRFEDMCKRLERVGELMERCMTPSEINDSKIIHQLKEECEKVRTVPRYGAVSFYQAACRLFHLRSR